MENKTKPRPTKRAKTTTKNTNWKRAFARYLNDIKRPAAGITAAIALVLGLALGHATANSKIAGATNIGETAVDSAQTAEVIASYTYDGKTHSISIQDLVDAGYTTTNADGSIEVPSATSILAYAQSEITQDVAKKSNVDVTDEDFDAFVSDNYGIADVATLAEQMNATEDQVRSWIESTVVATKLYTSIVGELPAAPDPITTPDDDAADVPTEEYGAYVLALIDAEYNAETDEWSDADSDLAATFANEDLSTLSDGLATYDLAAIAYNYQYQLYSEAQSEATNTWNDYMNTIYKDCSITIATMM